MSRVQFALPVALFALLVAAPTAAQTVSAASAPASEPSPEDSYFRPELRLGAGFAVADPGTGTRTTFTPRLTARYPLARRWQLEADWALGVLFSPDGVIENRLTGEDGADDTPRVGNPFIAARYAAMREPSGFSVDLAVGFAAPMASIPKPTPVSGPDFERTAHTEEVYRRALAADGFRQPWRWLWSTASLVTTGLVRQVTGPIVADVEGSVGLLIPAGRLRADVGLALSVSAYVGVDLDLLELGMRVDMNYLTPQRDEVDGALQLRGAQLALSPEIRAELFGPFYLDAALVVNASVEVEPRPERGTWGAQVGLGARL